MIGPNPTLVRKLDGSNTQSDRYIPLKNMPTVKKEDAENSAQAANSAAQTSSTKAISLFARFFGS